jgi:serine protease AprX
MSVSSTNSVRRKAVWGARLTIASLSLGLVLASSPSAFAAGQHSHPAPHAKPGAPGSAAKPYKLDAEVTRRSKGNPQSTSSVIVTLVPGATLPPEFKKFVRRNDLSVINAQILDLPNGQLKRLEAHPNIFRVHDNRSIGTHNYRTSVTVGAATVRETLNLTGAGIGVAVIDSGIATWHDDLTNRSNRLYPYGNQRVTKFVDFVNGQTLPYDDNGHGSHVAGIIAGNGYDSRGQKAGIAPDASIISLKVLDANGSGTIGNIIAALSWVAANAQTYNIRVVNMSIGASIHESYWTDPLTLAAKAVTDKGITIVAAAGNLGKNAAGVKQYGGITAPGNAPWVLTVGASSTMGTLTRLDDTMASYSSRGPTYKDFGAKPDLVAPGTGTVSLAVPGSTFYYSKVQYLLGGSFLTGTKPYLALSGTSMASPVVAGTVALMLQANPSLTPNLIKAILQYTAQVYPGYKPLEQGAGFLNTLGAVRLARFYANHRAGDRVPVQAVWSRQLIWGNHRLRGGYINPRGNAWAPSVVWGAAKTLGDTGDNIVWGTECATSACDNIVWGTADDNGDNIVWGTNLSGDNIVWGTEVAGDNIIWGTSTDDNIVWGTDCGGADCDNIIWGTDDPVDNIVWGTADVGDNIIWGASGDDNIVWGTSSGEDVTWGAASEDAELFADDDTSEAVPDPSVEFGDLTDPSTVPVQ